VFVNGSILKTDFEEGKFRMNTIARADVEDLLGTLDDNLFAALEATGATLSEITEAKSLADGTSDIVGQGERALAGPVQQAMIILRERQA
jgi:hypothetical protein